jgi:hypothetical protein
MGYSWTHSRHPRGCSGRLGLRAFGHLAGRRHPRSHHCVICWRGSFGWDRALAEKGLKRFLTSGSPGLSLSIAGPNLRPPPSLSSGNPLTTCSRHGSAFSSDLVPSQIDCPEGCQGICYAVAVHLQVVFVPSGVRRLQTASVFFGMKQSSLENWVNSMG